MNTIKLNMFLVICAAAPFMFAPFIIAEDNQTASKSTDRKMDNGTLLKKLRSAAIFINDNSTMKKLEVLVLIDNGDNDQAINALESLDDDQRDSLTMTRLAQLQIEKGERGKGIAMLNQALKREPKTALPYVHLGETYLDLGRLSEARVFFRRAIKLSSDFSEAYLGLLRIGRMTGNKDRSNALEYCRRVLIREKKNSSHYQEAMDHLNWLMSESSIGSNKTQ